MIIDEETRSQEELGVGKHYNACIHRKLTDQEMSTGEIYISMDPYQIQDVLPHVSSAMDHIAKKALRGCNKGDSEEEVLTQIISTAKRRLQILKMKSLNIGD